MKGQCHHAAHVVQVKKAAHSVFFRTKHKELSQKFPVNDNSADQQGHHRQTCDPEQKIADIVPCNIEFVVEGKKETAATQRVFVGHHFARVGVHEIGLQGSVGFDNPNQCHGRTFGG